MQSLYGCPNVRTTTRGAQLNLPPMKAFRAPGFVEGTFGLECLLDELAAKLGVDPLELRRRNHAEVEPVEGRSYSRQEPPRVLPPRRAPLGAPARGARALDGHRQARRRHGLAGVVRRRRPAELRVDSRRLRRPRRRRDRDSGRRHRHQDGARQIAAEELGIPLEHVTFAVGDSSRGPFSTLSAGSSTLPSMGPAVRAAAADAKRQILELAAQRFDAEDGELGIENGSIVLPSGERRPLDEIVGLLGTSQILGAGARGPNPAGMQVLTFGVQVAEVAVDVETGEVTVERVAAVHDVGRVVNPLGASSQIEGGIIQGSATRSPRNGSSTRPGTDPHPERSTPTGCRRSRTSPRSSASSSTFRTPS